MLARAQSHPDQAPVTTLRDRLGDLARFLPSLSGRDLDEAKKTLAVGWKQVRGGFRTVKAKRGAKNGLTNS
eukprot:scaffold11872_cov50-Isochrysis_galbana.AAC.2